MRPESPFRDLEISALLDACIRSGAQEAWEEFVRRLQPLVSGVVANTARRWGHTSPALVDDLSQETYLKLCSDRCRLLKEFSAQSEGALYAYVKTVAASVTHDFLKAEHASKRGGGAMDCNIDDVSPQMDGHVVIEGSVLLSEIEHVLNRILTGPFALRDRAIFWLYYRQGMTASSIAGIPTLKLSVKGVESLLHRITSLVRKELVQAKINPVPAKGQEPKNSYGV